MKSILYILLISSLLAVSCQDDITNNNPKDSHSISVIINDIPFKTEKYIRIGYTLKMWEYEKQGLILQKIKIIDAETKVELMSIDSSEIVMIYKNPLSTNPYFQLDSISSYYTSIQLKIPLNQALPAKVSHIIYFRDTINNKDISFEGGTFSPRKNETPISISSPVKGDNWLFINQSTLAYHFYTLFFVNGRIGTGERYAFDNIQIDEQGEYFSGDPTVNESYYNYKDTLFAVANGTVISIKDGRPENAGNSKNITFSDVDELGGNYLILDIGNNHYAFYAHCVPGSFMVKPGDVITEGTPIALLGNSGNSDCPHLHFQICDSPHFFETNGLPFVLKKYTKVGDYPNFNSQPAEITNSMMEEFTIISF